MNSQCDVRNNSANTLKWNGILAVTYLMIERKEINTLAGLLFCRFYFPLHFLCPRDDASMIKEVDYASRAGIVTSERESAVINQKGTTATAFVYGNRVQQM